MYQKHRTLARWTCRPFFLVLWTTLAMSPSWNPGTGLLGEGSFGPRAGSLALGQQTAPQTKPQTKPEPPPQKQDEAVKLSSRLVLVPVSATDGSGQPVKNLKVDDIVIEENGRPQEVVSLGEPGKTPIDLGLVVDISGSTHAEFDFEKQAAVQFVRKLLKPSDAVSLFSIGITPRMVKTRTTSSEDAIGGLMSIEPSNEPTAFFDAVVEAAQYLDKNSDAGSRRVLLVISDGEENYSKNHTLPDALRELQRDDCLFYAINPSGGGIKLNAISLKGQAVMDSLASETGGKAFNVIKIEGLESVFRQIAAELEAQYLFGYYATDEKADSEFRRITVRAPKRPDLRIRARQGYYPRKSG
jgi:Ca-activated chloride channel family protein